jgi:hypothetical protein
MAKTTQSSVATNVIEVDGTQIDLRNRNVAALLAWLMPGAGHWYQGRKSKGVLFCVTILLTYFVGFAIGGGHVVYASWVPGDKRWHYVCQLGVGAVALPALLQTNRLNRATTFSSDFPSGRTNADFEPMWGGWMSPPRRPVLEDSPDDSAAWYARWGSGYEMGTWYTMIAGLLNILVVYDAYAGPLSTPISGRKREKEEDDQNDPDSAEPAESS